MPYRQVRPDTFQTPGEYGRPWEPEHPAQTLDAIIRHANQRHTVSPGAILTSIQECLAMSLHYGQDAPRPSERTLVHDVRDFLLALDRGEFGKGHLFSDGTESAFVTALRDGLKAYASRVQAQYFEDEMRRPVRADLWEEVAARRAEQVRA